MGRNGAGDASAKPHRRRVCARFTYDGTIDCVQGDGREVSSELDADYTPSRSRQI